MVIFLSFSGAVQNQTLAEENPILLVELLGGDQNSTDNNSSETEEEEIDFISQNCTSESSAPEQEVTIYLHNLPLKHQFLFSAWRPPRS